MANKVLDKQIVDLLEYAVCYVSEIDNQTVPTAVFFHSCEADDYAKKRNDVYPVSPPRYFVVNKSLS